MTDKRRWRIALPIAIVAWTAFIWWQSLLSADESSAESGRVVRFLMALFGWDTRPEWLTYVVRKVAHFVEFALLGTLWGGTARSYRHRLWWLWGLPTGVIDECLQYFAPGRAPMVSDVLIDTAGYLCGVAIIWLVAYLCRKKQK